MLEEKLERLSNEPPKQEGSKNFLDDLCLSEQLLKSIRAHNKLKESLVYLNKLKADFKQQIDIDGSERDSFQILEKLHSDLENSFRAILGSDDLNINSDDINESWCQNRLVLAAKLDNHGKKISSVNSMSEKVLELENKLKLLGALHTKQNEKMCSNCEKMLNELGDCYVVYSK